MVYLKSENLEHKIGKQFDVLADSFPAGVSLDDKRVKTMFKYFGDIKGKKILDVGCGKGRFAKIMIEQGANITGIELSEKLLAEANKIQGGDFHEGSVTKIDFPDDLFDFVYCIEVLQHVPDTEMAISEMCRVLKKNGKIIIIDRNKWSLLRTVWKKYLEMQNKWMYPNDFPFREKLFSPGEIRRIINKYCKNSEIEYLGEYNENGNILSKSLIFLSECMSTIFPLLSYNLAWIGEKVD